ncbi:MAG: hypothetical protein GF411_14245 [Candidatus Lokiarchaeota archaeon]|nr:hypothetical protein [Candidatus Lokiarchaeota archaeon]
MTLPDNRIKFPSTEVDFNNDVGTTGQDHDNYPEEDTQARYDWIRLYLIGLLANQASYEEPVNYRQGSIWMNLTDGYFRFYNGSDFSPMAHALGVPGDVASATEESLYSWIVAANERLSSIRKNATFSGVANVDASSISIPDEAKDAAADDGTHPFLYKNGRLVDPRLTSYNVGCPVVVELTGNAVLSSGDTFTVIIQRMDTVVSESVIID